MISVPIPTFRALFTLRKINGLAGVSELDRARADAWLAPGWTFVTIRR